MTFGKTGLNPRATAEVRLNSFSKTLKKESHVIGLSQKELVFRQLQNKWGTFSGSFSTKATLVRILYPSVVVFFFTSSIKQ